MSRTYIKTGDGKVVNARPRKKPHWTQTAPKKDGYYWVRYFLDGHPKTPSKPYIGEILTALDGTFIMTSGIDYVIGRVRREWWPARIKEPK